MCETWFHVRQRLGFMYNIGRSAFLLLIIATKVLITLTLDSLTIKLARGVKTQLKCGRQFISIRAFIMSKWTNDETQRRRYVGNAVGSTDTTALREMSLGKGCSAMCHGNGSFISSLAIINTGVRAMKMFLETRENIRICGSFTPAS